MEILATGLGPARHPFAERLISVLSGLSIGSAAALRQEGLFWEMKKRK
jgi:hypothetical protein